MEVIHLEQIFAALHAAQARFVVVGGLAVINHGYLRTTQDIDLVVALDRENVRRAMQAFAGLGYRPKIPVSAMDFADPAIRKKWIEEKGMIVFQLFSDRFPFEPIDVFVTEPFDFDYEYERAVWRNISPETSIPFLRLEQLIAMKRSAARPQDLADIDRLLYDDKK